MSHNQPSPKTPKIENLIKPEISIDKTKNKISSIDGQTIDDKICILSGRNGSGKTAIVEEILNELKSNKTTSYLSLIYNLGFEFEKNRIRNVSYFIFNDTYFNNKKVLIDKNLDDNFKALISNAKNKNDLEKILQLKVSFLDEWKAFYSVYENKCNGISNNENHSIYLIKYFLFINEYLKSNDLKPIQLFAYAYQIYENVFATLNNALFNDFNPLTYINNKIDEFEKNFGLLKNKKLEIINLSKSEKAFVLENPTSGEIIIFNLLILKYINNYFAPINILIFDEPDRHFEPRLIEQFFEMITQDDFDKSQIIFTTHRPDTIALAWKYKLENKIWKVENLKIEKCDNLKIYLETLFQLTYNLREIMNLKWRVYVEADADYYFYKFIYKKIMTDFTIMSKERQLEFYSSSINPNNPGGGGKNQAIKFKSQGDNLRQTIFKNWNDYKYKVSFYELFQSFAIIDRDYDEINSDDCVFKLERHSIENYILDPIFLATAFRDEKGVTTLSGSNLDILNDIFNCINDDCKSINDLQQLIDKFFVQIKNKIKNDENKKDISKAFLYNMIEKFSINIIMIDKLTNENLKILDDINDGLNDDNKSDDEDLLYYVRNNNQSNVEMKIFFRRIYNIEILKQDVNDILNNILNEGIKNETNIESFKNKLNDAIDTIQNDVFSLFSVENNSSLQREIQQIKQKIVKEPDSEVREPDQTQIKKLKNLSNEFKKKVISEIFKGNQEEKNLYNNIEQKYSAQITTFLDEEKIYVTYSKSTTRECTINYPTLLKYIRGKNLVKYYKDILGLDNTLDKFDIEFYKLVNHKTVWLSSDFITTFKKLNKKVEDELSNGFSSKKF